MAGEQLRVKEGEERGRLLRVDAGLLIGRTAPDRQGRLGDDPELSRRHAQVSRGAGGQLTIEDLGSANGTFVNDERIDGPRTLVPGDVVRMGKTVLQVTDRSGAVPAKPRPPMEELVVTAGADFGRRLALGDELVLGRAVSGEGKLSDDRELSRRHARVARDASGRLTIEDLDSANGTFLNGERLRGRRPLELGDIVRMGSTTLELVEVGRAPGRQATPPPLAADRPRMPVAHVTEPEEVESELPLGTVFAGCRIEEVIGHGDMGIVYRADELALQRLVALKVIRHEFSREERFRERFRRESRIAAAIDHPNVIPIFDAGDEAGVLFITMRLVEGTDLRALVAAQGRLEPLRAARIVRQVGAALDAAHARGMLHRDVKPSNVLLGREDHAYLTDFGLAKPAGSTDGLTRHGTVIARAAYVAPEQISNERVDARADVYALGCLLFEALTGETPLAQGSERPLAHSGLPREFDDVLRRALARDPRERYPSAGDLGQAALVAAGGLRRARPESIVATGDAAFALARHAVAERVEEPQAPVAEPAQAGRADVLRWAIALAGLVIVAVGMLAALHGISTLSH